MKLLAVIIAVVFLLLVGAGAVLSLWEIPPPAQPIERPLPAPGG